MSKRRPSFSHMPARQALKGIESEWIPIGGPYHERERDGVFIGIVC